MTAILTFESKIKTQPPKHGESKKFYDYGETAIRNFQEMLETYPIKQYHGDFLESTNEICILPHPKKGICLVCIEPYLDHHHYLEKVETILSQLLKLRFENRIDFSERIGVIPFPHSVAMLDDLTYFVLRTAK